VDDHLQLGHAPQSRKALFEPPVTVVSKNPSYGDRRTAQMVDPVCSVGMCLVLKQREHIYFIHRVFFFQIQTSPDIPDNAA
jgi:hypothetical protein